MKSNEGTASKVKDKMVRHAIYDIPDLLVIKYYFISSMEPE